MYGIQIHVEAITEWHEPKDYEFYPALRVDAYELSGSVPETQTLLIHRCEDIKGLPPSEDKDVSLMAAREWLGDNYQKLIQEIIAAFGE